MYKIGCIGTGAMGSALMAGVRKKLGENQIALYDKDSEKAVGLSEKLAGVVCNSEEEVVKNSEIVVFAVKPNVLSSVLEKASGCLEGLKTRHPVFVSIAAGISLSSIEEYLPEEAVIRVMPNMPALTGNGMIGLTGNSFVKKEVLEAVSSLLSGAGLTDIVPESMMDAVTAVSGSGPAFVFMFIQALADGAVKCGMPRQQAVKYAAQTVMGSAKTVLETGRHPEELKDSVCSPGGTTIDGVQKLEEYGFRNSVMKAVEAAFLKSKAMGKN